MKCKVLEIVDRLEFSKTYRDDLETLLKQDLEVVDIFQDNQIIMSDDVRLYHALMNLIPLKDRYDLLKIPESIFYATLEDLKFRIERYYNKHEHLGLSLHDIKWSAYIFNLETFKIGTLKFRKYPLTYQEIERSGLDRLTLSKKDKKVFYEGLPVIYVHLEKGADLSDEAVDQSFKEAKLFFDTYFSDYKFKCFICRTWLLYPGLKQILNDESRILKFQDRFTIIASHHHEHQALERVYGSVDLEDIVNMDKRTSLQKTMFKNINHLGVSVGVIWKEEI